MRKNFRKLLALVLTLCTLATLAVPTAYAAEESFRFPEYGASVDLGEPLLSDMSFTEYVEIVEYEGKQYLMVPAKGARLYVFDLTAYLSGVPNEDGNYIYSWKNDGIGVPRGITQDSKGTVYVVGDSSNVFYYSIRTGRSGQIKTGLSGIGGITVDEDDNVYVSGKNSTGGAVYRINTRNNNATAKIYETSDLTTAQTIVWGGDRLYIEGPVRASVGEGAEIHELTELGAMTRFIALPKSGGVYYLSYLGGVVFAGSASAMGDGLVAVDTTGSNLKRLNLGKTGSILGAVTNERNGKAYLVISGEGLYEYNVKSKTLGKQISKAGSRSNKTRTGIITYGDSQFLLSLGSGSITTIRLSGSGSAPNMSDLFEGAYSTYSGRSITPGVEGTGVSVYIGGYLTPSVSSYSPDAEEPMTHKLFSNGHAQTDNMITYNGKIYGGAYSGGYLFEYDPVTGVFSELIHGLKEEYDQIRIHGLAAGDNKIFFSTIPNDQEYGGCIGWYDLVTCEYYCERNVVKDQVVISLAYDEETDILYGASSVRGGTNTSAKASQAVLMAYDVNDKKVLAQTQVNSLTGDKVRYISGIARDPDTGKLWGLVSQTMFSFTYSDGKLTLTKEWAAATTPADAYPDGASKSWFPRPILFDGKGNLYVGMNEEAYGLMKFTLGADGKIAKSVCVDDGASRIYTLGADGNLYIVDSSLRMITLNRATMVKEMIRTTRQSDREGIRQARLAYDSLTQSEKDDLGSAWYEKLVALENSEQTLEQETVARTVAAIDSLGAVTVTSGGDLAKARMLYDSLKDTAKTQVTNYQLLADAETAFAAISEKTVWGEKKSFAYQFNTRNNDRVGSAGLTSITYDHITGGTWEYAMGTDGSMDFSGSDCIRLDLSDYGWIALRIKVSEAGLYDVQIDRRDYQGCLGGVYVFPVSGSAKEWQALVEDEMNRGVAYTEHYVGSVDYTGSGTVTVGKWECDAPGEYILALNCLQARSGSYASPASMTLSKQDPVSDATVELVKSRINAIGTVDENSGSAINEARITYDSLTAEQKALIYAELLTRKEAEYAKIEEKLQAQAQADALVAVVQVQISAIGAVTENSGAAIQAAREAFDALTAEQQAMVSNAAVLTAAEAAYAELTGGGGGGNGVWIIVLVAVLVLAAGAVATVIVLRKKKAAQELVPAVEEKPSAEKMDN